MYHVLCVDDNFEYLKSLKLALKGQYQVSIAQSFAEASDILRNDSVDLVLLDVMLDGADGIRLIKPIRDIDPNVSIVMLSAHNDTSIIVRAMQSGADDYLVKPFPFPELKAVIEKSVKEKSVRDRSEALNEHHNTELNDSRLVGRSAAIKSIVEKAHKLKGHDTSVLIEGESGTGKEVLAKYIYSLEQESKRPFIAVNCAAIPENLLESELFGHEKGAFTGAIKRKIGKFELADGGDLFLDEVNSLRPDMQAKLLRVLQEKEFYRVGGDKPIRVNIRVIAASNQDLNQMVQQGGFRQDLYYRLRVIAFQIPALRDRLEDLEDLIDYFMFKLTQHQKTVSPEVRKILLEYRWPGNSRELKNLLESLVIMASGNVIHVSDLPRWVKGRRMDSEESVPTDFMCGRAVTDDVVEVYSLKDYVRQQEAKYIQQVIDQSNGNVSKAAEVLKVSRSTIYNALNRSHH